MNEQVMAIPTQDNFKLIKVKRTNTGGVQVQYEIIENVDGTELKAKYNVDCLKDIHPDMRGIFFDLEDSLAAPFDLDSERTCVDGISMAGKNENEGVILSGTYLNINEMEVNITTPRIKLSGSTYGIEVGLRSLLSALTREVYLYLFKNKHAQLELFDA